MYHLLLFTSLGCDFDGSQTAQIIILIIKMVLLCTLCLMACCLDRRRRRRSVSNRTDDEIVFQEIRIEDKFKFEAHQGDLSREMNFNNHQNTNDNHLQNTVYWNAYAFASLLIAFVLLQLFVIFVCWLCLKSKSQKAGHRASPASIYESAVSDYASTIRGPVSWDNYYK